MSGLSPVLNPARGLEPALFAGLRRTRSPQLWRTQPAGFSRIAEAPSGPAAFPDGTLHRPPLPDPTLPIPSSRAAGRYADPAAHARAHM